MPASPAPELGGFPLPIVIMMFGLCIYGLLKTTCRYIKNVMLLNILKVSNSISADGICRKPLLLLRKSNPPLLEWLGSPIIYLEEYSVAAQMRALAAQYYSATASAYHYLHMARGNYREYLKGERVWLKKYFYVLRPILAVKWIEQGKGIVPTEFNVLVDRLVTDTMLKKGIDALIEAKRKGDELDYGPRIGSISEFLEQELDRFGKYQIDFEKHSAPIQELDKIFFSALKEVWAYAS